jgi:phospholipid transport system transporter-binding protein
MTQIVQIDHRWNLNGDVVIATVSDILVASKSLNMVANTTIDFAQVNDIDTATISLILEWQRRAQKENQTIKLVNLPANLVSLTQLYGVADLIQ